MLRSYFSTQFPASPTYLCLHLRGAMNGGRSDRQGYEKASYEIHVAKVRDIKGTVDCQAPRPHPLGVKINTDQRRRQAAIEVDNIHIMGRLAANSQSKMIDNEIRETTAVHSTFRKEMLKNRTKTDLQRITCENQQILKRIQEASPAYSQLEWMAHSRNNEIHKRRMSSYPEYYEKFDKDSLLLTDRLLRRKSLGNSSTNFSLLPPQKLHKSLNTPVKEVFHLNSGSASSSGRTEHNLTTPISTRISSTGKSYFPILSNSDSKSPK